MHKESVTDCAEDTKYIYFLLALNFSIDKILNAYNLNTFENTFHMNDFHITHIY